MHLRDRACINPNYNRLRTILFNKGIPEPKDFAVFAEIYLPYGELPQHVRFDSSFERAYKIIESPELNPIVYGDYRTRMFAIRYEWGGTQYLTIFMEGINYVQEFIEGLKRYTPGIPRKLAEKIARALQHDSYYVLSKTVFYDNSGNRLPELRERVAMQYANTVARRAYARAGEDISDILNGPTAIFSLNGDRYADIDDGKPYCFIIEGVLYIYNP